MDNNNRLPWCFITKISVFMKFIYIFMVFRLSMGKYGGFIKLILYVLELVDV